ncbi:MAG: hypothetical protein NXI24_05900 [bacterium]|nr:hypothetical protein [bacterium]
MAAAYPYFSPVRIQNDLAQLDAAPRKRWGQCFLIEPRLIQTMADRVLAAHRNSRFNSQAESGTAAAPILEIGPGLGALTWPLLQAGASVAAIEIDPAMGRLLSELAGSARPALSAGGQGAGVGVGDLWLFAGDARDVLEKLRDAPVEFGVQSASRTIRPEDCEIVCGNLPYYITTDLLVGCMALPAVRAGFFLTQLEFAERIVAADARSSLNVYLRNFGEWRQSMRLKASAFYPRPRVDSAFIEFAAYPEGPRSDGATLQKLLRMSFGARRKKLANSWKQDRRGLLDYEVLCAAAAKAGVDSDLRAEAVPVEDYYRLARVLGEI